MVAWPYLPGDAVGLRVIVRRLGEHNVNKMVFPSQLTLISIT